LKFLTKKTSKSHTQRFLAEARATAQLSHENIIALHDIDEHAGALYMVLEYVKGQMLKEWLNDRARRGGVAPAENEKPGSPVVSRAALSS
jgi:serine/threonine protein kinase